MPEASLTITERDGWAKNIHLQKSVVKIGSSPLCDVQLTSPGIAPLHLQVFYNHDLPTGCRVVNLGGALRIRNQTERQLLPTLALADLQDGHEIRLGEFTIEFNLPMTGGVVQTSRSIEATVLFSDPVLRPDYPLEGLLTVKNLGSEKTCQPHVDLSGLPEDCYRIDPIPLIYPSAQEDVRIQLFHKSTHPAAGQTEILLTVTALASYPGERLVIRQGIYVSPVFKQELEIIDDMAQPEKSGEAPNTVQLPVINEGTTWARRPSAPEGPAPLQTSETMLALAVNAPARETLPANRASSFATGKAARPALSPVEEHLFALEIEPETLFESAAVPDPQPDPIYPPAGALEPADQPRSELTPDFGQKAASEFDSIPASAVESSAPVSKPESYRPPISPRRDLSALKVVRNQVDDFWDDE
jgi:hypothetical protein